MDAMQGLRIALAYNLRTEQTEEQAELLGQDYVDHVQAALESLGHTVTQVEVSGAAPDILRRIKRAEPELVFNLAEGQQGVWREAFYPTVYEFLDIPHTGAGPAVLGLALDKRLTGEILREHGVDAPRGHLITTDEPELQDGLRYPLMIKPNYEGSSMGIHQDSVVETPEEARRLIERLLEEYPEGLDVEEFITGRELTVGFLGEPHGGLTEVVEYRFPDKRHNIVDYEAKQSGTIETLCPAPLTTEELQDVQETALRAFDALRVPDAGRVDLRLREDGRPFLIEINPLPGLRDISPLVVGAMEQGLSYADIMNRIVASAARRHGLLEEAPLEARR